MAAPDEIEWAAACSLQARPNPAKLIRELSPRAEEAIGTLAPGCRILGLTLGRFSFGDLIRAVCRQTGPADVTISTWTAGIRDLETMAWVLERGRVKSIRFILGDGFVTCCPGQARRLVELYGPEALLLSRTHAKFAMIRAGDWHIVIRTSMNLSRNPRIEQFELDDDPAIYAFYASVCDKVAAITPAGPGATCPQVMSGRDAALVDEFEAAAELDVEEMLADMLDNPVDVDAMIADLAW